MVFPSGGEGEVIPVEVILTADTQKALEDLAAWRAEINRLKEELRSISAASGESLTQVRKALMEQKKATSDDADSLSRYNSNIMEAQKELTAEMAADAQQKAQFAKDQEARIKSMMTLQQQQADKEKQLARETTQFKLAENQTQAMYTKEVDKSTKSTTMLGQAASLVFGGILGVTAIGALRQVIRFLGDAAKAGYEFAKSIFQLEVGVRALQRAGMDVTIAEVYTNIRKLRQEFGIFSEKELVKGTAELANLTRDLGFTSDEFFNMQNAVATLAVVNGRAMDEVQKTVALALSSGYTEGLQRLGVSINRVTIAQEAATMGFKGGYNALTEIQRAQATYNLILEKTALYQKDLYEYQKYAPGQIDRAKSAWADLRKEVGGSLLPIWGFLASIFADAWQALSSLNEITEVLSQNMGGWGKVLMAIANPFKTVLFLVESLFTSIQDVFVALVNLSNFDFSTFKNNIKENFTVAWKNVFGGDILGDTEQTAEQAAEKLMNNVANAIANNSADLEKAIQDSNDRRVELAEDLQRDLAEIERDGARRREEIEKINTDASRDIADANRKYAYDLAKLKDEENKKIQDVIDKYRKKEIEDEENFQAKMKKLREEFIFDLEEAVRSRDAVAIRRLQRRFNLDKQQLIDAYELEKKQRERNFRDELEDAKRQNAEKRRELWIAFQQKLADIELQRQYELQDAAIKHQQDLEDLRKRLAEQREDRLRAYRQDLEDLNQALVERLKSIAKAIAQEVAYTAEGAKAVYEALKAYYGPGGYIEQLYKYYLDYAKQVPAVPGTGGGTSSTPNFAYGGSMVASTPTTFRAGETVPEVVTVTPIMNRNNNFSEARQMGGASVNGMMKVLISLSPGLEGKIIENTLNKFDGILAGVERSR
jgi:hypothetical protein